MTARARTRTSSIARPTRRSRASTGSTCGLKELDFGRQQRLNYVSLIRAGGSVTAELKIEQPALAGSDNRFMSRIQEVVNNRFACVFAIPDRGARESMELSFTDESIPFEESLQAAPENAGAVGGARVSRRAPQARRGCAQCARHR